MPGEIMVGLFCEFFATKQKGQKVVHDPRLVFNIKNVAELIGADPIQSQTGHLFMKESNEGEKRRIWR